LFGLIQNLFHDTVTGNSLRNIKKFVEATVLASSFTDNKINLTISFRLYNGKVNAALSHRLLFRKQHQKDLVKSLKIKNPSTSNIFNGSK
jgi:hypothetical protein